MSFYVFHKSLIFNSSTADSHILKKDGFSGQCLRAVEGKRNKTLRGFRRENGAVFSRLLVFAKPTSQMHRKLQKLLRKEDMSR